MLYYHPEWVKLENAGEGNARLWPVNELNKKPDGHPETGVTQPGIQESEILKNQLLKREDAMQKPS